MADAAMTRVLDALRDEYPTTRSGEDIDVGYEQRT
jgi:hypothetical protein